MRKPILIAFAVIACTVVVPPARAIPFVSADWKTPGDGLLTRHSNPANFPNQLQGTAYDISRLEWLDVSLTLGLSFNQVSARIEPGQPYESFRYATSYEVIGLFWGALDYSSIQVTFPTSPDAIFAFADVAGITVGEIGGPFAGAIYDRGDTDTAVLLSIYGSLAPRFNSYTNHSVWFKDSTAADVGSFLVREYTVPVSEPSLLALMGAGMVVLAGGAASRSRRCRPRRGLSRGSPGLVPAPH